MAHELAAAFQQALRIGELGAEKEPDIDVSREGIDVGECRITDTRGRPTWAINLPFEASVDDPRVAAHIAVLDRENPPLVEPTIGTIHFGDSRLVKSLRYIPALQALLVAVVFLAGVYVNRTRGRADRGHL